MGVVAVVGIGFSFRFKTLTYSILLLHVSLVFPATIHPFTNPSLCQALATKLTARRRLFCHPFFL
jgi:hypothetical protein